jgi:nucleoside-diphosphate-sugar epimerase
MSFNDDRFWLDCRQVEGDGLGSHVAEADWTDPDTPGLPAYPRSKAIAERTAWDFIRHEGGDTGLVVVNPTFILGPTLTHTSAFVVAADQGDARRDDAGSATPAFRRRRRA